MFSRLLTTASFQSQVRVGVALVALAAGSALAHNHITVDTASGAPGDRIIIRAGYLASDAGLQVRASRLLEGLGPMIYQVPDQLAQAGPLDQWFAGDELLLTSDFFVGTGHLAGGDFRWEIRSVVNIYTGQPGRAVWGTFGANGLFTPSADSAASTQAGRSFDTLVGSHLHQQGYAFTTSGVYDLTLVAWDANGKYAESTPVTVRFWVGVKPAQAWFASK